MKTLRLFIIMLALSAPAAVMANQPTESAVGEIAAEEAVYTPEQLDVRPEFAGGDKVMYKWIKDHLSYPEIDEDVCGRVVVEAIVEKDGSLSGLKVVEALHPEIDEEALRLVGSMPAWTPGSKGGKAVRTLISIPLNFTGW